jgi:outer membrane protein
MYDKTMKLSLALLAVLLIGAAPPASAAEKIGVVNVRQLMESSPQARVVKQTIENEFAPRQRELESQQKEYQARAEKLERDAAVMSESERNKLQRDLRDVQRDFERRAQEFQEDLQVRQNEEITRMQRTLLEEIQSYAKAQGFDLILGEGVLYSTDALNVTSNVLSALEAKSKSGGGT